MKIDWEKIPGYKPELTAEEKLALYEGFEDPNKEKVISKARFDEVASQLADANKKLKAKMSDDEVKEAERNQQFEELTKKLQEAERRETLSNYRSAIQALGFDEASAGKTAEALADGKMTDVFSALKLQRENMEKDLRASIMKETSKPPAGDDINGKSLKASELFVKQLTEDNANTTNMANKAMNYYMGGHSE